MLPSVCELPPHHRSPSQGQKGWHPPVQVLNEVPHIIWQNDSVLAHVTVVAQHTHRHMGWHFGKLPENIVEGPLKREGVFCLSCVTLRTRCALPFWSNSLEHLSPQAGFRNEQMLQPSACILGHCLSQRAQFPCTSIQGACSFAFNWCDTCVTMKRFQGLVGWLCLLLGLIFGATL